MEIGLNTLGVYACILQIHVYGFILNETCMYAYFQEMPPERR